MSVLLVPIALALDAFGVSLSLGFSNKYRLKQLMLFCFSFGLFQFFLSFIGAICGGIFNSYILNINKFFGGFIILLVGFMMLKEAFSKEKEDNEEQIKKRLFNNLYIALGISVSVDALVVGFSAYSIYSFNIIFMNTLLVGIVTSVLCVIAIVLSMYLRKKISFIAKYADLLGGIILILFGLKMIFT